MTISCPSCGLAFETRATTNTRCRRCRHVVRIGRSSAARHVRPSDELADSSVPDPAAGLAAVVVLAAAIVLNVVLPPIARAIRRRPNRAPTFGRVGSDAESWSDVPTPAPATHTGPTAAPDEGERAS